MRSERVKENIGLFPSFLLKENIGDLPKISLIGKISKKTPIFPEGRKSILLHNIYFRGECPRKSILK
jgi:hypothetical protein